METISRRDLLKTGAVCALGTPFYNLLKAKDIQASHPGPAKAVIEIWMWGGPSHLDTFDPKPDAGNEYTGPYNDAIATNADGIQINAQLPLLAKQADKYSLIRSMTHGINAHETATYRMQTGRPSGGGVVYPCIGAVVSKIQGLGNTDSKGLIPDYIALTSLHGRFSSEGFLGPNYKPFATGGDPNTDPFVVEGVIAKGISDQRQQKRRTLLHDLDSLGVVHSTHPDFQKMDQAEENAYDMILGDARKIFDLREEPEKLRESYGRNTFGQSCMMARRLIENGTRYVTINARGWDTHKMHFTEMGLKMPQMDRGLSVLLQDLNDRGLLDSTIVWCCGEFGRTPRVLWDPPWNGGRGHHGACFSALLAGGGFSGGQVIGSTDAQGNEVTDRPVYPQDLHASIYSKLGIDPSDRLPNESGLDIPVTIPSQGKGPLTEIM